MNRLWPTVALGFTAMVLTAAVAGPPVVGPPPVSIEGRVQKDFRYRPDTMSTRQSSTYTTSSVGFEYSGIIGPDRPVDIGAIDLATGRYVISFSLPVRFTGLTDDPLVCSLVERGSGIPLVPADAVTYRSGAPWTVLQADTPLDLPQMTVALRCATAAETIGSIEIGESSLLAVKRE